jgi:two-component system LytT family response regulator
MIKAILVDDEIHGLDTLSILLAESCPEVQVIDRCSSAKKAIESIKKLTPDLVFLDIEMPTMNGFELLEHFGDIPFSVIFTTSYDQYAIKAIRFSALDYLLKPVDPKELIAAISKIEKKKTPPTGEQLQMLMDQLKQKESTITRVAIPTSEGFELVPADQIVRCEADDNYTYLFLKNAKRIIASRTLKEIEEQLKEFAAFIRVHHSYIVNLNEVVKYVRGEGGYLVMTDGSTVNVSRSRKEALLKHF